MLPFRAAARTAPRRLAASAPAALRAAAASPVAGPSRLASEYLHHSRPPLSRALHASHASFKDKRWVNSALKEGKDKDEAKEKEEEAEEDPVAAEEAIVKEVAEEGKSSEKKDKEVAKDKKPSEVEEAEHAADESTKDGEKRAKSSSSSSPMSSSKGSGGPPPPPPPPGGKGGKEIAKPSIPEVYPQVLALPITRRPLFPGFYKAVTITSPSVIKAIRELITHGQPYIGAFLLKDSDSDSDVITSMDQVHPVGVFAQITSVFSSADQNRQPDNEDPDKPETLTAVLYPHRRIHIDELVAPNAGAPPVPQAVETKVTKSEVKEAETAEKAEAEVASFEKDVPSVEETREALHPEGEAAGVEAEQVEPTKPQSQIGFLHPLVPEISLTNVSNLDLEPYKKDSQVIRAIMGEILAVFKEIAQLQPIFREQSEWPSR